MKRITQVNRWYELKPTSDADEWPTPRSGHACVIARDCFLYIFGGMNENGALNDMYEYNIPGNIWRKVKPKDNSAPSGRVSHGMVNIDQINKIFMFGGVGSNLNQTFKNELWEFDTVQSIWRVVKAQGNPPSDRYGHTMNVQKNYIFFFGGTRPSKVPNQPEFLNDLWQYNFLDNRFKQVVTTGAVPQGRYKHQTLIIDDNLYLIGGFSSQVRFGNISKLDLNTRVWSTISLQKPQTNPNSNPILFKGRYGFAVYHDSQKIFIYGGYDEQPCSDMLRLDLQSKQWKKHRPIGTSPSEREFFGFASHESGLFILGGRQGHKRLNDLFVFKNKHDKFSYKFCGLRDDMKNLFLQGANESMVNVEIFCSHQEGNQTFYSHTFLLKQRWKSLYRDLSGSDDILKVKVEAKPVWIEVILIFVYSAELIINHLEFKDIMGLLEYLVFHDVQFIVPKILEFLLFTKEIDEIDKIWDAINYLLARSESSGLNETNNKNFQHLAITKKILQLLKQTKQTKSLKDVNIENEKSASDLFYGHIYVSEEKILDTFYSDFENIYNDKSLANFSIECEGYEQIFQVHLPILIARSHYFQMIYEAKMYEANTGTLKLQNIRDVKLFEKFLKYLYTGYYFIKNNSNFSPSEAITLLEVANYFELKNLSFTILIENYVMQFINQSNCIETLNLADRMNFQQLKMKSVDYICANFKEIMVNNLTEVEKLPKDLLLEIMKQLTNYTLQP